MKKTSLLILLMAASLCGGVSAAAVDTSQPPDPQGSGGPVGDGEDWAGDGRAPLTAEDAAQSSAQKTDAPGAPKPAAPGAESKPAKKPAK
ncbi:MAG: hypothetical protein U1E83_04255 [Methylotetracoccus sp.]